MRIEITNGHVIVRENANRGAVKAYKREMFKDLAIDSKTQETVGSDVILLDDAESALDAVVLQMIIEIVINDKQVEKTSKFIEELDDSDFQKIAKHCTEKVLEALTQKKTLKTKSKEQSEDSAQNT